MNWDATEVGLDDETRFETLNGLWTGKKPPFVTAGVIRNTNFTESGRIDYSDVAWLQVEQKQLAKRLLKPGDTIVERSGGGPKQPVGRVVYFGRDDGAFSFSNFTSAIRIRDAHEFDAKFVFYRLLELYQSGRTEDIQRRTTGIRNLDFTAYKQRATFPQIPVPEQRKIAGVLAVLQGAAEQQERLLALTAELKKALRHRLFTAGLRNEPKRQTDIGPLPKSWDSTPLGTCCDIVSGSMSYTDFLKAPISEDSDSVTCMAVKVSDMNLPGNEDRFITANAIKSLPLALAARKLIPARTLIFPKRGAAIATNKKRVTTTWTVLDPNLIGVRCKAGLDPQFLYHWSQTFDLRKITDPGPTPQLNKKDLVPVQMPVPREIEEQREIARILDLADQKFNLHRRRHATLNALFRTLLHQLMTAQIRIRDIVIPELDSTQ